MGRETVDDEAAEDVVDLVRAHLKHELVSDDGALSLEVGDP